MLLERKIKLMSTIVVMILLSGCGCGCLSKSEKEKYEELSPILLQLNIKIDSYVRYELDDASTFSQDQIIDNAVRDDEILFKELEKIRKCYSLKLKIEGKNSILLLCTKDNKICLIEDSGCTKKIDFAHWEKNKNQPCEFTLDLKSICR